ncbi:fatty acyl-AMP ligase [Streptomyces sp. NPDC020362]|uniref:fatty acyl-AMP ligase n=1 Tax=unclassified Streptomyces TaxID=2593676 RepID=UPI0033CCB88D
MTGHPTFTDHIRSRVAEAPDREALVLLTEHNGELRPQSVSYAELDREAGLLAAVIRQHVGRGQRVLVLHSSRKLFSISFLACLYADVVAVPVAPLSGGEHHDERIAGIFRDAAASCVLTSRTEAPDVTQLLARTGHERVVCLPTDGLSDGAGAALPPPQAGPDDVAFLQYTSGSTRDPRGVIVTHRSLLANNEAISQAFATSPGSRIGGWLPLHHDMGLIGQLLHALWLGGTAVLLSPVAFVKRPAHWLETISRYGLTVSGAPDFAYDWCVRRINDSQLAGLDLAGWRIAVNGGEPVNAATVQAFTERFASAGLRPEAVRPSYGLAESTLLVAGHACGPAEAGRAAQTSAPEVHELREPDTRGGRARTVVACGRPAATEVRIVDPDTREPLADGHVGEIWVRGDSVARGYWGRPKETAETFDGRVKGGEGGYLRTGDLGMLREGLLYVTGRIKDMIVVAGRNLYPQDLERTVQGANALFGPGTAFAVTAGRERIVVVQELRGRGRYDIDLADLAASVQRRLSEVYEVRAGGVLLVRPGTVRRTTSGKLERVAMRRLFLSGEITVLHQSVDPEIDELVAQGRRR